MKIHKKIPILVAVLCLILPVFYATSGSVVTHPINQVLKQKVINWGDRVDLTSEYIMAGLDEVAVLEILHEAGFHNPELKNVHPKYRSWIDTHKSIYLRKFGDGSCNVEYLVFLEFKENNELLSAHGTAEEAGCL